MRHQALFTNIINYMESFIKVFYYKGIISQWFLTEKLYEDTFCKEKLCKKGAAGEFFFKISRQIFKI